MNRFFANKNFNNIKVFLLDMEQPKYYAYKYSAHLFF